MTDAAPPPQLVLDLDEVMAPLQVGVRRAKVFISIGSQPVEGDLALDAMMGPRTHLRVFASPPTPEQSAQVKAEYAAWITDCVLRDLDVHFHLFLDRVWLVLQFAAHGALVPAGFQPQGIERETNSAVKAERVMAALGEQAPDVSHFRCLSNARNVLAHHVGIVPADKAHHDGRLKVSWLSLVQRFIDEDGVEHPWDQETGQVLADKPTRVQISYDVMERFFAPGERISLTPHEVVQIALFYEIEGGKLFDRLVGRLREAGILRAERGGGER
ncbi:hypothetical protein [Brevundimonas sp.]|uniref:hypothetical protein n=1 Tax=Brevundimonas sp. TaxID=1871086 RepID=UPI002ED857E5